MCLEDIVIDSSLFSTSIIGGLIASGLYVAIPKESDIHKQKWFLFVRVSISLIIVIIGLTASLKFSFLLPYTIKCKGLFLSKLFINDFNVPLVGVLSIIFFTYYSICSLIGREVSSRKVLKEGALVGILAGFLGIVWQL